MSEINVSEILQEILAEKDKLQSLPILATRYSVIRTASSVTDDDGHYLPPDPHRVSPYFGTKQDAERWMKEHQTPGYNLSIRTQHLREFTEQRWSNF